MLTVDSSPIDTSVGRQKHLPYQELKEYPDADSSTTKVEILGQIILMDNVENHIG